MTTETVDRMIPAELDIAGDGRTIIGRCVPYGTPALVADGPDGAPYLEVWRRGAFAGGQWRKDPARIPLVWMHDEAFSNELGHATAFADRDDGLEGTFRAYAEHAEKTLEMIRDGSVRGLSIRAAIIRSRTLVAGVVERTAARLVHVALVREPAYPDARVMAVRSGSSSAPALELVELRAVQDRLRVKYAGHV